MGSIVSKLKQHKGKLVLLLTATVVVIAVVVAQALRNETADWKSDLTEAGSFLDYEDSISAEITYYQYVKEDDQVGEVIYAVATEDRTQGIVTIHFAAESLCKIYLIEERKYLTLENYSEDVEECAPILRQGKALVYRGRTTYPQDLQYTSNPRLESQQVFSYLLETNKSKELFDIEDSEVRDELKTVVGDEDYLLISSMRRLVLYSIDSKGEMELLKEVTLSEPFDMEALVEKDIEINQMAVSNYRYLFDHGEIEFDQEQDEVLVKFENEFFDSKYIYSLKVSLGNKQIHDELTEEPAN